MAPLLVLVGTLCFVAFSVRVVLQVDRDEIGSCIAAIAVSSLGTTIVAIGLQGLETPEPLIGAASGIVEELLRCIALYRFWSWQTRPVGPIAGAAATFYALLEGVRDNGEFVYGAFLNILDHLFTLEWASNEVFTTDILAPLSLTCVLFLLLFTHWALLFIGLTAIRSERWLALLLVACLHGGLNYLIFAT